jgi:hypothetical protein
MLGKMYGLKPGPFNPFYFRTDDAKEYFKFLSW